MPPTTTLGRISGERFKGGPRTFTHLSRTVRLTNLSDMTSLAASGRLQNAIKYCTKAHKTGAPATSRIILPLFKVEWLTFIHADLLFSHTEYDVHSYFLSAFIEIRKNGQNAVSDGFILTFSDLAFCLPHQLVGILFSALPQDSKPGTHMLY